MTFKVSAGGEPEEKLVAVPVLAVLVSAGMLWVCVMLRFFFLKREKRHRAFGKA